MSAVEVRRAPTPLSDRTVSRLRAVLDTPMVPSRYQLRDVLGEGGMGVVWRAHDLALGRDVALKLLAPHLADSAFADGPLGGQLMQEARLLASLEHPGIVPVFDVGTSDDGTPWYAMRLVHGTRLDVAARDGRARRDLLRIVETLGETVAYAHAQGVVHRDLTPGNVMLGPFGEVLVLDWGVAHATRGTAPDLADGQAVGTPGFMAPEQAAGAPADARSDVYSLGALLRWLVSVHDEPVPRALHSIIACATAHDPDARYASALALRDDLRQYAAGDRVAAHRESYIERLQRFATTYQTAILLVVAYLILRVAFLLWRGR
ncbi:MAG: serine/threonine protein kinase [Gemmatimonadetes bacterium]|nr:serine/threonine protein kinase [Gemmatimonadota bacterium]